VATYLNEQESAESAVFSPDGRFILTNPDDYGAEVYACDRCFSLAELLELAQTHVTRELTLTAREKYLHQVPEK